MKLIDGLGIYKTQNTKYYRMATELEEKALEILALLREQGEIPTPSALIKAKDFLMEVEKWKAGCLQQRMGNAVKNSDKKVWAAFQGAINASDDIEALLSIMQLTGFGSTFDDDYGQRRAKVATSVLRFLWPEQWGVVDWRTETLLSLLNKHDWDADQAMDEARQWRADECRKLFECVDEQAAVDCVKQYRIKSQQLQAELTRAADVEMAIFGLSLKAWPL